MHDDLAVANPAPSLAEWISAPEFPCVGAKSSLLRGTLESRVAGNLLDDGYDERIVTWLQDFALNTPLNAVFVSCAIVFPATPTLDEAQFETALWERLQAFNAIDARRYDWDENVSSDPQSPHFSMSIGGHGFYVIGLHPGSGRQARRFQCAALVFNPHAQFEALRDTGRYEKLRTAIAERDIAYSGSRNPMLADHGKSSEARQYSGRRVDAAWRCPFSARQEAHPDAA